MAKYNLINNGTIYTLTTSGTGNKDFTLYELAPIIDGTTNSGGITLIPTDDLYLEGDLYDRIKVDEVRLYAEDLTLLSGIDFYYKNHPDDDYASCTKGVTADYYYAIIPGTSAPRYILATLSGFDSNIYEYQIINDDYIIGFGEDGTTTAVYLEQTPAGEESTPQAIHIFNNNTETQYPANAYVVVDNTNNVADSYLSISTHVDGTYYGSEDGITLEDDLDPSTYKWFHGTFSNISTINNDYIHITSIGASSEGKVTTLPMSFAIGISPWDYDYVNDTLYTVHYDGLLKLYKYVFSTSTWTFISELPLQATSFSDDVCMVKAGDYIYANMRDTMSSTTTWGRYDLNGAQDNWEWLAAVGYNLSGDGDHAFIYTGGDYIYTVITNYQDSLIRYTISTDTWIAMDGNFDNNNAGISTKRLTISYDASRNCLYMLCGEATTGHWVQRYNIGSDSWDRYFFDFYSRISTNIDHACCYYYDDRLFFRDDSYGNLVYIYNIVTDTVSSLDIGFTQRNANYPYLFVVPPQDTDDDFTLLQTNIANDTNGVYAYNMSAANTDSTYYTGTYTTPIFDLGNKYYATYYNIEEYIDEGNSAVTKDIDKYPGTIEIRSSDIAPTPIIRVYWPYGTGTSYHYLYKTDITTGANSSHLIAYTGYFYVKGTAVDVRRNRKFANLDRYSTYTADNYEYILGSNESVLYSVQDNQADYYQNHYTKFIEFAYDGTIWGYSSAGDRITHIRSDVQDDLYTIDSLTNVTGFSVEYDGDGVWYVDRSQYKIIHLSGSHVEIGSTLTIPTPYAIAASANETCWVSDSVDLKLYKLDSECNIIKTISTDVAITTMARDYEGGFYCYDSTAEGNIYHYDIDGNMDMYIKQRYIVGIKGCPYGCILYDTTNIKVYYVDRLTSTIQHTISLPTHQYHSYPDIFWTDLEHAQADREPLGSNYIPHSADSVWGSSGNLPWIEVPKGSFLPKDRYQQTRLTLQSRYSNKNPEVHAIVIPKPVKITGIQAQDYQDVYVKTLIPADAETTDFSARLKVWWDVQE